MDEIFGIFLKLIERQRGQAMTEYALILAAVAILVYVAYQLIPMSW